MAILEVVGIFIAAAAAWASFRSARAAEEAAKGARDASRAELVARLLDEYSTAEMLKAIAGVRGWDGRSIDIDSGIDRQRRLVSHYFQKIARLAQAGLLEDSLLRVVVSKDQAALFCWVVEPMEKNVNVGYDSSMFDLIANLYGGRQSLPEGPSRVAAGRLLPDIDKGLA